VHGPLAQRDGFSVHHLQWTVTSDDIQQAPSLKINQSDTDLVTGKVYDNLPLTFFAKCAEDHGRSEVSSMSIAKRQISDPNSLQRLHSVLVASAKAFAQKDTSWNRLNSQSLQKIAHDSMISHDFTWFHMMHILMHESSKSSWDMWSIAWSWVPGSKGVWNLEGAQPWEPPPSSSPNSKWSSSRPNLQGHCVALCGSASGYTESFASCLAMS
jgi:hypothetical protein